MQSPRPTESSAQGLALELRCDLKAVQEAAGSLCQFLASHGLAPETVANCELAFVEACNNAIQNTAPNRKDLPIAVRVSFEGDALELRIRDHTPGFEFPEDVRLPPAESERGRGLFLIQQLMDCVAYSPVSAGNELVMRKRLDAPSQM